MSRIAPALVAITLLLGTRMESADLPEESPLWQTPPPDPPVRTNVQEQVRNAEPPPGSPSGLNRVFSSVSVPTYSIHRPPNPNGVGLVICPGGGFRDVWIDREGHDLALWLKDHNVTCLVLKYRTFAPSDTSAADTWPNVLRAAEADARQAIRELRKRASALHLDPHKIGICGFSAGGMLALRCAIYPEPKSPKGDVSAMPDFAGLFYPGIPEDVGQAIKDRAAPGQSLPAICPVFIMNASDDQITPADKCVELYASLLKAGVKPELHIFGKGSHGFDMGTGRGVSAALWPESLAAWLKDSSVMPE
jgi:acetyl esterase/lipase